MTDSLREIVFDTETTGLDARVERVIEIGAIELVNRFPTGRTYHVYINPDGRQIDPEAQAVHGITAEQLAGKPIFSGIVEEFCEFIEGAALIAHNAGFDMGFINAEFARCGRPPIDPARVIDTLAIARRKHPMGPNSLDALCKRYGVDNSHRTRHGALLDSGLLAEVYIELIGGKQAAFGLSVVEQTQATRQTADAAVIVPRPVPLPPRITDEERAAHAALVASLGEDAVWLKHRFQPSAVGV